jgi:hypothetical protein
MLRLKLLLAALFLLLNAGLCAKPSDNLSVIKKQLAKYDTADVNSIHQVLEFVRTRIGVLPQADRDSAFIEFSVFYNTTMNEFNEKQLWNNDTLTNKLYADSLGNDPEVKALKEKLTANGLGLYMTEGNFYVDALPDYLYENFSQYVSPSIKEFLRLRKDELAAGFSEDAGLVISFEELGERVINWEKFIDKFPDSPFIGGARSFWDLYVSTLLSGMDNSRIFNFEDNKLRPEVKQVYNALIDTYPRTRSGKLVAKFYKFLEARSFEYSPAVDEFYRENKINSMLGIQPRTR